MKRLALLFGLALLVGCKGFASSQTAVTPLPSLASSARVSESGVPKMSIDRGCSKLGDASDEYVCIHNDDTAPVDMGSWIIRNVMGRTYNFPTGFSLPAGQMVKVHTGSGTNSATDLHWGYNVNPAWEKTDKLTLHNNEDVEVFVSTP